MENKQLLNNFFYYKILQKYYILTLQIKYILLLNGVRKKSESREKKSDKIKRIYSYDTNANELQRTTYNPFGSIEYQSGKIDNDVLFTGQKWNKKQKQIQKKNDKK